MSPTKINESMINHARTLAEEIGATAILVYVDVIKSRETLESLLKESNAILAARDPELVEELSTGDWANLRVVKVPHVELSRLGQIKVATILALSSGFIGSEDLVVCLSGSATYGILDNLRIMDVSHELEVFSSRHIAITKQVKYPHVFERLLTLALELSEEGKEGKSIGTTFVLGDHEKVMELSSQMVLNPFGGVPETERNVLDSALKETLREFASIDGAFVIRDDGMILAAGRHLKAYSEDTHLPQGLGARHRSAAGITALTGAVAIVVSESTGDVRVFGQGRVFMEIDKAGKDLKATREISESRK
jgi:diadenylate cyclase